MYQTSSPVVEENQLNLRLHRSTTLGTTVEGCDGAVLSQMKTSRVTALLRDLSEISYESGYSAHHTLLMEFNTKDQS